MAITQTKRPNRELSQSATGAKRPARKSFDRQGPLAVQGGPPNKVLRIVNDVRNRIHQALSMGYVFVSKDSVITEEDVLSTSTEMGSAKSFIVGYDDRSNKPIMGYLMAIDKDVHDENQEYKQEDQDNLIRALGESTKNSVPGSYVPK